MTHGPSDPGATRNDLSGRVYGNAYQLRDVYNILQGGPAPRTPHQLPPPAPFFVNRTDARGRITAAVRSAHGQGRAALVHVHGLGGIGTTSTAVKWHDEHADLFADGEIYVDLLDERPADALRRIVTAWGFPDRDLPTTLPGLTVTYRSMLRDKRTLVLLDNVRSAAEAEYFSAASPGSVIIATGQEPSAALAGAGFTPVQVDALDLDNGISLLTAVGGLAERGIDRATTERLAERCGGYPLVLTIVAGLLASCPPGQARRLALRLAEQGPDTLDGDVLSRMTAPLDAVYRELDPAAARAYRALTAHPGAEFGAEAAAATLGDDPGRTVELLDRLVRVGLLTETGERYRFHGFVRWHARRWAREESHDDLAAATIRAAEWYATTATACDALLSTRWRTSPLYRRNPAEPATRRDRTGALAWLDTERANLLGCAEALERLAADGAEVDELICCFPDACWNIGHLRGYNEFLAAVNRIALAASERLGAPLYLMSATNYLGCAYVALGESAAARGFFERSLPAAREAGHALGEQSALEWIGKLSEPEESLTWFAESWRVVETRVEQGERARAFALLGLQRARKLIRLGRHADALTGLAPARSHFDGTTETDNRAKVRLEQGRALCGLGRLDEATAVLVEARAFFLEDHSLRSLAGALDLLADVAEQRGDRAAAAVHLRELVEVRRRLLDPDVAAAERRLAIYKG